MPAARRPIWEQQGNDGMRLLQSGGATLPSGCWIGAVNGLSGAFFLFLVPGLFRTLRSTKVPAWMTPL